MHGQIRIIYKGWSHERSYIHANKKIKKRIPANSLDPVRGGSKRFRVQMLYHCTTLSAIDFNTSIDITWFMISTR